MIIAPAFIMILGGLLLPVLSKFLRPAAVAIIPFLALYSAWNLPEGASYIAYFASFKLQIITIHDYTMIFASVFCIAAFAGGIFALKQMEKDGLVELSAAFVYAGSALGAVFSGDLITLFIFWEMMAIASTIVVLCGRTIKARQAAMRYAYMHFFGGVVLLMGIIAYHAAGNDLTIANINIDVMYIISSWSISFEEIAILLILTGLLVNAAAPPFSSWLADSYPEASPSGAVFLSAFTTKTAVFVLLTIFAGTEILIYIGLFMVFYGIIYAMLENDMRRILSYSIINQVGFMITGIGIGTQLALYGVAAHAFCHIIYKALLLMSAGSVIHMTGKHKCSEVGGLWHSMKFTAICGIIGAMAISAFPWTSGFVSKSMISSSAAEQNMLIVWMLLAAASAGVFLHAGIKFPWFVFFQKDSGLRPKEPPISMRLAMFMLSAMCILPGLFPQYLYKLLPGEVDYQPYTTEHVVTQLQLLLFAGFAFFALLPMLKRTNTISLDMDWIYRVPIRNALLLTERMIVILHLFAQNFVRIICCRFKCFIHKHFCNDGVFARSWSLYSTVTITGIMLGVFLMLYYSH